MKKRWQPPYYETENATGLPHEKIFTIVCYVDKFTTTGNVLFSKYIFRIYKSIKVTFKYTKKNYYVSKIQLRQFLF